MLILAQIPSFHSLRHINLVSLVLCLLYSACAAGGSIYIGIFYKKKLAILFCYSPICTFMVLNFINITIGNSSKAPEKNYSLKGDTENRLFGVFNALSIIATTYGNGIIPEIQVWMCSILLFEYLMDFERNEIEKIVRKQFFHYSKIVAITHCATLTTRLVLLGLMCGLWI
jgi:hypothetical protein